MAWATCSFSRVCLHPHLSTLQFCPLIRIRALSGQRFELGLVPEQCWENCPGKRRCAPLFLANRPDITFLLFQSSG